MKTAQKPDDAARALDAQVEEQFGLVPNFFRLSPEAPEIAANLWAFTKFGYLDNPLPSLFKDRLFIYLSRFCEVRYCIARHVGFLAGLGHASGDGRAQAQTVEEIVRLLRRPLPRGEELTPMLGRCASTESPLRELPESDSPLEEAVFALATHAFLETSQAPICLATLSRLLGTTALQNLLLLLAFVRTAHYWTKVHPELTIEEDIRDLLATHSALARCIWDDPEARACDVGDRVMGELESLRKASRREGSYLAAIVDSSDDAIVSKDLNGVITSWNASAERMFGYTAEEAVGKHITMIIPKDRHEEEARIIGQIRRGERVEHFETVRVRKNGSLLDLSLTIAPVKNAAGTIIGASKIARDIAERKRAQEALARSARQHRALYQLASRLQTADTQEEILDAALAAICDALKCDRASILLYDETNALRFVRWRGLSDEYRNATEGHSPWKADDSNAAPVAIPVAIDDVSAADLEPDMKARLEREGIAALSFAPLIDDEKVIGKFITYFNEPHAFTEDETELSLTIARQLASAIDRKRGEIALRRSEEELRKLAESLDVEVKARTAEVEERNLDVIRQAEQLRQLSWRMMQVQDEERRHMARELHDSAGQMLAVLAMNLGAAQKRVQQTAPEVGERIAESEQIVQRLDTEIRTMSYLLHPPLLDESGLGPALSWYVQGLQARSGMEMKLHVDPDLGRLPNDLELLVFRIVQEGLTNIHRHSESKIARISVGLDAEGVAVEVEDKGKGIAPEKMAEIQSRGSGVGIRGMRERVRQFNGEMRIESNGSGTRISVRLPYENDASGAAAETGSEGTGEMEEAAPAKSETADTKAFVQRQPTA